MTWLVDNLSTILQLITIGVIFGRLSTRIFIIEKTMDKVVNSIDKISDKVDKVDDKVAGVSTDVHNLEVRMIDRINTTNYQQGTKV